DHGEALGEHNLFALLYGLYDELVWVPLMIRYPKKLEPKRVSRTVSTIDLFATLVDLAELPEPEGGVKGVSLFATNEEAPVFSEFISGRPEKIQELLDRYPDIDIEREWRPQKSVVAHGHKLVRYSDGEEELYDLVADPNEQNNLAGKGLSVEETLSSLLTEWQRNLVPHVSKQQAKPIADEDWEELKALGYVQ
ncbi:MAG: sulfatase-like hydrolase/transferase, partial [Proteobacteria bacterium]|nr:sulfatase-like hydrolase/transferase [Pseudomonadota bacterium]